MLRDAILNQIKVWMDYPSRIIYENADFDKELDIEAITIITKISELEFRVYQGWKHASGNISTRVICIEEAMFKAMTNM
jgi:hypothetical protein